MSETAKPGQIILLVGAPRAGKSSIIEVVKETYEPPWMNLGLDTFFFAVWGEELTFLGEHSHLFIYREEPLASDPANIRHIRGPLYTSMTVGMFDSIAAHAHQGLNVVADVCQVVDDFYREPVGSLLGLPVLLVGVRCPIEVIMERRIAAQSPKHARINIDVSEGDPPPAVVRWWQQASHVPGIYDLEVDTSELSPEECAGIIREHLDAGRPQTAFQRVAQHLGIGEDPSNARLPQVKASF